MWWLAVLLSASAPAPLDTLVVIREVGDRPPAAPTVVALEASAERAVQSFWALRVQRLRDLSVPESVVRACGVDPNCLARVVVSDEIRLVVYAVTNWRESPPLVTVAVIDVQRRDAVASRYESAADGSETSVGRLVERCLLDAEHRPGARLTVEVTPPSANIDLEPNGVAVPNAKPRTVAPGRYDLTVSHEGYETMHRSLDLVANRHERLTLALVEESSLVNEWWFWTGVGVVAVAGVLGTLAAVGTFNSRRGCLGGTENCVDPMN